MNITLSVDDELLKQARKIAIDHDKTLPQMIRQYIAELVEIEAQNKCGRLQQMKDLFEEASMELHYGERDWTRDDLHER
ncbi:MAG: DUF6364 family protein [Planctomycetia bacterium]|jgi:hypothetical protein